MPLYQYYALDPSGKKRMGVIEGVNISDVKETLRQQAILLIRLEEKRESARGQHLTGRSLITFTMQLSQLVGAGVPLYESIATIEEQSRGEGFHRIILSLLEQVKGGKALSEAMRLYPDSFDTLYCTMIKAGESAGALEEILEKLTHFLSKREKLKKQIVTAMIYPSILGAFSLLIILLLLGFVVPSIEGIFEGRQLNGFTRFVIGLSHLFQDYWWLGLPLFVALVGGSIWKMRTPSGKKAMQRMALKIPFVRTLTAEASLARFTRTMATLQVGGLTMIESLHIARDVMGNVVLEEEVDRAEEKIIEGSSLSREFGRSKWIPKMVSKMLAVGEESGNTNAIFNKIADLYEEELEKSLERIMALAQPVILIVMGAIIGMILMAILLPLTDISSFAG